YGQNAGLDRPRDRRPRRPGDTRAALRPPARRHRRAPRRLQLLFSVGDLDRSEYPSDAHLRPVPTVAAHNRLMSIKSDHWIKRMALEHKMIDPFVENQVRSGVISFGLSSYGYDIRVADEFKVFTNINNTVIDPKSFDPRSFVDLKTDVCIVPPNSFALARTVEYFRIPRDVLTVCLGKSTYARCGIIVNVTP